MKRRDFLKKDQLRCSGICRISDPTEAGIVVKIVRTFKYKRTLKL